MHVYIHMFMCVYACMLRHKAEVKCILLSLSTLYSETGPVMGLELSVVTGLANQSARDALSLLPGCWG